MNDLDKQFLIKHGFQEDVDKKLLTELFINHKKFKEVNISVDLTEPVMLVARSREKNVIVDVSEIQDKRLILKRGDRYKTYIMNIFLDEINNCLMIKDREDLFDFEFEIRDFRYSLVIKI